MQLNSRPVRIIELIRNSCTAATNMWETIQNYLWDFRSCIATSVQKSFSATETNHTAAIVQVCNSQLMTLLTIKLSFHTSIPFSFYHNIFLISQFKDDVSYTCRAGAVVASGFFLTKQVAGSNLLMTNIFSQRIQLKHLGKTQLESFLCLYDAGKLIPVHAFVISPTCMI